MNENRPKDFWGKLQVVGSPLIAIVGLIFTVTYQNSEAHRQQAEAGARRELDTAQIRHQHDEAQAHAQVEQAQLTLQRLDVIQHFAPYLMSKDGAERTFAINMIKNSGDDQLATRLGKQQLDAQDTLLGKQSGRPVLDTVFAKPSGAPAQAGSQPPAGKKRVGWAYLGDYDEQRHLWATKYLDFASNADPGSLKDQRFAVSRRTGTLNVRSGLPTIAGDFPKVIDVLPPGVVIHIHSVRPWQDSSYQWAEVDYGPGS